MKAETAFKTMSFRDRILAADTSARTKRKFLKRFWLATETLPIFREMFKNPDPTGCTRLGMLGIHGQDSIETSKFYAALGRGIAKLP
jgi:hypothetical protein